LVILGKQDAKRFSAGLVGLKGEIGGRILSMMARDQTGYERLLDPAVDVLDAVHKARGPDQAALNSRRPAAIAKLDSVDHVIQLSDGWRRRPHRTRLWYFVPDWHDRVDPDFNFDTDTHSGGIPDWSNEVYGHQLFGEPTSDGILVSRSVLEKD